MIQPKPLDFTPKDSFITFIGLDFMQLDFSDKEWTIGNVTNG